MRNLESKLMAIHVILQFMSIVVFIIGIFMMSSSVLIVAISMLCMAAGFYFLAQCIEFLIDLL